eukprot:857225-Rhodomonas_salina.9
MVWAGCINTLSLSQPVPSLKLHQRSGSRDEWGRQQLGDLLYSTAFCFSYGTMKFNCTQTGQSCHSRTRAATRVQKGLAARLEKCEIKLSFSVCGTLINHLGGELHFFRPKLPQYQAQRQPFLSANLARLLFHLTAWHERASCPRVGVEGDPRGKYKDSRCAIERQFTPHRRTACRTRSMIQGEMGIVEE